jgi:hypothetical protein
VPTYRIYIVGRNGGFLGAAEVVECVDDNEAIGAAVQIASGLGAEIWDQKRFVHSSRPAIQGLFFEETSASTGVGYDRTPRGFLSNDRFAG